MDRFRRWIIHPFLFSVFPILTLLNHNLAQIKPAIALRSVLLSLLGAALLLVILRAVLRSWGRAALVSSLFLILFFTYGHVYESLKTTEIQGVLIGRHRFLLPVWAALLGLGAWWALARVRDPGPLNYVLNAIALAATLMPLAQMGLFEVQTRSARAETVKVTASQGSLRLPAGRPPPDIYYLILDAYTREDVLQEVFGFDNRPFLDHLEGLGFYVATCSQSNYAQTELSLASSLNFNYHEALEGDFEGGVENVGYLPSLIRQSSARQALEELGYTIVAFETGYYWSQWEDVDFYLTPSPATTTGLTFLEGMNSFEVMLMETTAGLAVTDGATSLPWFLVPDTKYPAKRHRERVLNNLDALHKIPLSVTSPKFVFAHLIIPHKPFVFGPQGELVFYPEPVSEEDYQVGYRDQVIYLNRQLDAILADILALSRTPPVIILQGDHGPGPVSNQDRLAILNAYYLPGEDDPGLYPSISPVNTFRVIFNRYLGADFELLEDLSYYSGYDKRFDLTLFPNDCAAER